MGRVDLQALIFPESRRRIVESLRREPMTADELARALKQTGHAIRAQLRTMERDGLVEPAGLRPGRTRPFAIYRLTREVEQLLSRAYGPFLARLVEVLVSRKDPEELESVMRDTGRALSRDLGASMVDDRPLRPRVVKASRLMNAALGAVTRVEEDGDELLIRGAGCPVSAVTVTADAACLAIETLLADYLRANVTRCCETGDRPRCCFRVDASRQAR